MTGSAGTIRYVHLLKYIIYTLHFSVTQTIDVT